MNADARAEAERRWPTDHREPNGISRALNEARQQGWDARGEWQASLPFTEEDAVAAAKAFYNSFVGHDWDTLKDVSVRAAYIARAGAALDAVHARNTARHTKEGTE